MHKLPKTFSITVEKAESLAKSIALKCRGGEVFALTGPLGAGKTTFARHLAKALGVKTRITSPTFVLEQIHSGKLPANGEPIQFHHLDLYRIGSEEEMNTQGFAETWGKPNTVTLIEWADKFPKLLPTSTHYINFSLKKQ